jgi:hypothetical protein
MSLFADDIFCCLLEHGHCIALADNEPLPFFWSEHWSAGACFEAAAK